MNDYDLGWIRQRFSTIMMNIVERCNEIYTDTQDDRYYIDGKCIAIGNALYMVNT